MKSKLKGIIAAPYTPLDQNGDLNLNTITEYHKYLVANEINGAFINGSTGDFTSLTTEERNLLTEEWCKVAGNDFSTIVHVGHTSLKECQQLALHAGKCGANYISTLSPFYFKPSSLDLLIDFCAEVASVNPEIPFLYYHIPVLTGYDASMVEFIKKAKIKIPNFAGIKYTKEDMMDYKLTLDYDNDLVTLFGVDEIMLSSLAMGASGWVGSTYSHAAPIYTKIKAHFDNGEIEEAGKLQNVIIKFIQITSSYGWSGASKYVLKLVGIDCGSVRAPHKIMSERDKTQLENDLKNIGFFKLLNKCKSASNVL